MYSNFTTIRCTPGSRQNLQLCRSYKAHWTIRRTFFLQRGSAPSAPRMIAGQGATSTGQPWAPGPPVPSRRGATGPQARLYPAGPGHGRRPSVPPLWAWSVTTAPPCPLHEARACLPRLLPASMGSGYACRGSSPPPPCSHSPAGSPRGSQLSLSGLANFATLYII